ncbi:hypothetical protein OUZ56_033429 [Daphnia magna]|uniref:Uncharacterized protein n=1 Tax=Daphnia magna TaxID=35525 RepID=A0ABR0BAP5_9CRUS|nr:hypothetical protein OUZ56_033429 [Daphnia magna]
MISRILKSDWEPPEALKESNILWSELFSTEILKGKIGTNFSTSAFKVYLLFLPSQGGRLLQAEITVTAAPVSITAVAFTSPQNTGSLIKLVPSKFNRCFSSCTLGAYVTRFTAAFAVDGVAGAVSRVGAL